MSGEKRKAVVEGVCIVLVDPERSSLEWMPHSSKNPRELEGLVPLPPVRASDWYALTRSDGLPAGHIGRVKITVEWQSLPADESKATLELYAEERGW